MIKRLAFLSLLTVSFALAQTNDTFTMQGFGCSQQGCVISPNDETTAPWVAQQPEYPPSSPLYYPSTIDQSVTTGLSIPTTARSLSAFPAHQAGTGSGTFNWFSGGGPQGSVNFALSCTWDLITTPFSHWVESCSGSDNSTGQSVQFTRNWYATQGRFGIWSLHELKVQSAGIVPIMILVVTLPD